MNKAPTRENQHFQIWLLAGALVSMTFVAYLPALSCEYIWDDDDYVTKNATLRTAEGLRLIWSDYQATPQYYPLVHTTYWIEYQFWELWAAGYHATNIFLHAANAVLLWLLLRHLKIPGAWLAAAIFALHPVHVESVAWITERKNTLSGFFYLAAAIAYFRFADASPKDWPNRRWWAYGGSLVLFLCALLSKTVTVTLPPALLVILWWRRGKLVAKDIWSVVPMFLIAVPMGCLTVWMEKHHVGTKHVDFDLSILDRILIAGRAVWFYASKLAWPVELTFIYPRWDIDSSVWWQWLPPMMFFVLIAALWKLRARLGNGPLAAVLFFVGTLSPALGFVDVYPMRYSFVADHFQYLASIGLITLAAAAVFNALHRVEKGPQLSSFLFGPMLTALALFTWAQCHNYADEETLWLDTIAKNNGAAMAHNNLAHVYVGQSQNGKDLKKLKSALKHFNDAIDADPEYVNAYYNRGLLYIQLGGLAEADSESAWTHALSDLSKSIEINSTEPRAFFERARVHELLGDFDSALGDYDRVVHDYPQEAEPYALRAEFQARYRQQWAKALADYDRALRLAPDRADLYLKRGLTHLWLFQDRQAELDFAKCLAIEPKFETVISDSRDKIKSQRAKKQ